MDIYCPKCREPWELDSLHEEVSYRWPDKPWYVKDDPRCRIYDPNQIPSIKACALPKGHPEDQPHRDYYSDISFNAKENKFYVQSIYSTYFNKVRKEFYANGCEAFTSYGTKCSNPQPRSQVLDAIYEVMGDDIDGAMAEIEDAQMMGLLDDA